MQALGWAQIHRDFRLASDREAIVVDVRYNRGGHLSQLVVERLARRVIGWDLGRYRAADSYPNQAPRGPIVFVANQWSGSDGDIVCAAARAMDIGPIIGVRTWGGVVGIDGRFTLVDGTMVTQPRYATWMQGFGFGLENHGVDPDIEVPFDRRTTRGASIRSCERGRRRRSLRAAGVEPGRDASGDSAALAADDAHRPISRRVIAAPGWVGCDAGPEEVPTGLGGQRLAARRDSHHTAPNPVSACPES